MGSTISVISGHGEGSDYRDERFQTLLEGAGSTRPQLPPSIENIRLFPARVRPFKHFSLPMRKWPIRQQPHRMNVEISFPAGIPKVFVRPGSNPYNLIVDFTAPGKVRNSRCVIVTPYDSSDLQRRFGHLQFHSPSKRKCRPPILISP